MLKWPVLGNRSSYTIIAGQKINFELCKQGTPRRKFRGKNIKTQAHRKNNFFPLEVVQRTYMNLYSFESSMKWPFLDIFTLRGHKNL